MRVTVILFCIMVCVGTFLLPDIEPSYAVVRSYDQDVRTVTMSSVMTANADQLFTVSGGAVEIVSFFGQVTTIIASTPGDVSIILDSAVDPNYDADFSIVVTLADGSLGDVITFGALTNQENAGLLTGNENAGQPLSWFCPVGEIEQKLSGVGTGVIKWYMSYRKLDKEAVVTAN